MPFKWKDDKQSYHKKYHAEWYQKNKETVKERKRQAQADRRKWFQDLKSTMSCMKCGASHPAILDFHHRDKNKKELELGNCVSRWSRKHILSEIEKCDILCANCHRIHHWNEKI